MLEKVEQVVRVSCGKGWSLQMEGTVISKAAGWRPQGKWVSSPNVYPGITLWRVLEKRLGCAIN